MVHVAMFGSLDWRPSWAGLTLKDPCFMLSHSLCDSSRITNPQHSGHLLPWGSSLGTHSGVTPKVGQGMHAELKAASSGEMRR